MDEDEAALLAELRAISAKSARSRFDDDNNETNGGPSNDSVEFSKDTAVSDDKAKQGASTKTLAVATQQPSTTDSSSSRPPEQEDSKDDKFSGYSPRGSLLQRMSASSWFSKRHNKGEKQNDVVVDASPSKPAEEPAEPPTYGIKSDIPSTFSGERGGAAEDEELLAELRAISAKSSSADRFAEEEASPSTAKDQAEAAIPVVEEKTVSKPTPKRDDGRPPPWKRGSRRSFQKQPEVDVVVAAPPRPQSEEAPEPAQAEPPSYGITSDIPSTFIGERGGAAEDEELLAELRAISAKSSSADRFAEEEAPPSIAADQAEAATPVVAEKTEAKLTVSKPTTERDDGRLPPWKRGSRRKLQKQPEVDVVVAAPPRPPSEEAPMSAPAEPPSYGIKSDIPSTFNGERGGTAEDEELLAELRAISAKSSSADRFVEEEAPPYTADDQMQSVSAAEEKSEPKSTKPKPKPGGDNGRLPPWKRGSSRKVQKQPEVDIVVAAPPPARPSDSQPEGSEPPSYGIKSDIPSTFSGERGGAAEDDELLAELRAISNKSSGADRFTGEEDGSSAAEGDRAPAPVVMEAPASAKTTESVPKSTQTRTGGMFPPWKRGSRKKVEKQPEVDVVVAAPPPPVPMPESQAPPEQPSYGIKSDIQSTFKGERGGAAEDAELLALLRGVSNNAASSSRFAEDEEGGIGRLDDAGISETSKPVGAMVSPRPQKGASQSSLAPVEGTSQSAVTVKTVAEPLAPEEEISREDLPSALKDRNWKVRSRAYDMLGRILLDQVHGNEPTGDIDAGSIVEGLDDLMPALVEDSNAKALDKALEFGVLYAEYCRAAGSSEQAARIASSLLKKNAFSSRPSTLKLATSLALKLMEVGSEGLDSVHGVVDVLLNEGLASKKPKVVQASASVILEAAYEFGAASLPLATITSSASKMLSHSNAKVRDTGLKIIAEICRALGSKSPLQGVIDGMKKAQVSDLDSLLASQPEPAIPRTKLRSQIMGSESAASPEDAMAAMEAGAKELEAKRFAARPAVNLMDKLPKTDYSSRLQLHKWSEKVAALDIVLETAGEKPYKLVQPSKSVNYAPLISDMKILLSHTHFAVAGKAMQVLSMLAEGVGEKLYPLLRPLLPTLLQLSKDKKLNRPVSSCLDSLFGNVLSFEHLLDSDDALPDALDERKQKNALARSSALDFLGRCVKRGESAGPKGILKPKFSANVASFCALKLDDSDASVRKAAMGVFRSLQALEDSECAEAASKVVESLKTSHSRAYKTLTKEAGSSVSVTQNETGPKSPKATATIAQRRTATPSQPKAAPKKNESATAAMAVERSTVVPKSPEKGRKGDESDFYGPILDDALAHVAAMRIPQWDAAEDDGGVLSGLQSSKWLLRQDAIKAVKAFVDSGQLSYSASEVTTNSSCILVVVREHTRSFKETNVNIMKAVMQLFIAICDYHEAAEHELSDWAVKDGAAVAAHKISDKKLLEMSKSVLTALCAVCPPSSVLSAASDNLRKVKSPVAHEEYLRWLRGFCDDFGAASIGSGIADLISWILEELEATNPKVKREAQNVFGHIFTQLGPPFKALALSMCKKPNIREQVESTFGKHPYDASIQNKEWPKKSIALVSSESANGSAGGGLALNVPKSDLFLELPEGCVTRMGSKEGKTAWKIRKGALDDTDAALKRCSGLLDTCPTKMKQLVELVRALRDRLSDTQINLKPLAARIVAALLGAVDKTAQARLGKIVYGPLINAAMNDIKKPMRDACLEALRSGITSSSLDGGGLNEEALEGLVTCLVAEVNESSIRAGGLPDVLSFLLSVAEHLPNLDNVVSSRGQSLGEKYAEVVVECLTSSKSETRAAASSLLDLSIERGIVSLESVRKATERLKPAKQRTIGPMIAKLSQSAPAAVEKENLPSSRTSRSQERPAAASERSRTVPRAAKRPPWREDQRAVAMSTAAGSAKAEPSTATGSKHPLVSRIASSIRSSSKSMVWPEFPEEPSGNSILGNLKRLWSPLLPSTSVSTLFPNGGIRKQDDAKDGCELLSAAIAMDRSENTSIVKDQIDLVLKWTAFVLCSKEATVGLQALLSLIGDQLSYLIDVKYEMSDAESLVLVPFLLEKASNSKGRFQETYTEIVSLLRSDELLPPKRLGAVVCVLILERSIHAKARLTAYQMCLECIEKAGLAGVGKRGVVATAKLLSDERIPENKAAALDLMESIVDRMNNDVERLSKICGTSLSEKARQLVEERCQKRDTGPASARPSPEKIRHNKTASAKKAYPQKEEGTAQTDLYDELPALTLRERTRDSFTADSRARSLEKKSTEDPFAFSLAARRSTEASPASRTSQEAQAPLEVVAHEPSLGASSETNSEGSSRPEQEPLGAAASLRARLLKIREKSRDDGVASASESVDSRSQNEELSPDKAYHNGINVIKALLEKEGRLTEDDIVLIACIETLKTFHAALSKQQNAAVDLVPEQLEALKDLIAENMNVAIELLTRLIGYAFDCGEVSVNAGMSIPLLSVCLATLMALFRDPELSLKVSEDDMTLLIRETATALLDSRLSSSSELDEATSSQMVRAINKLAVQAATGAARHTALQALMTLQQQLSLEVIESSDNGAFNSRLSRVVSKLFARVIKAEEGMPVPYSSDTVDMESLICSMEDILVACQESEKGPPLQSSDSVQSCSEMVKILVLSILKAYQGAASLRSQMNELDIDSQSSALGLVIASCEEELDMDEFVDAFQDAVPSPSPAKEDSSPSHGASRDVATLVSNLANAMQGPERDVALEALREYKAKHGSDELNIYFKQMSSTFRDYVEEQLADEPSPPKRVLEREGSSMSERIANLRSRLQATEVAVQTAVEDKPASSSDTATKKVSPSKIPSPTTTTKIPSPTMRSSKLAQPTPSKLSQKKLPSSQTLRERLAAAQESRKTTDESSATTTTTSMSRAAALRARLEAVKKQNK